MKLLISWKTKLKRLYRRIKNYRISAVKSIISRCIVCLFYSWDHCTKAWRKIHSINTNKSYWTYYQDEENQLNNNCRKQCIGESLAATVEKSNILLSVNVSAFLLWQANVISLKTTKWKNRDKAERSLIITLYFLIHKTNYTCACSWTR